MEDTKMSSHDMFQIQHVNHRVKAEMCHAVWVPQKTIKLSISTKIQNGVYVVMSSLFTTLFTHFS